MPAIPPPVVTSPSQSVAGACLSQLLQKVSGQHLSGRSVCGYRPKASLRSSLANLKWELLPGSSVWTVAAVVHFWMIQIWCSTEENEGEFRVGSRVIQIARAIWQDC